MLSSRLSCEQRTPTSKNHKSKKAVYRKLSDFEPVKNRLNGLMDFSKKPNINQS